MKHFKDDNEKVKDSDFPMIGLHSQRNEDYTGVYNHLDKKDRKEADKK